MFADRGLSVCASVSVLLLLAVMAVVVARERFNLFSSLHRLQRALWYCCEDQPAREPVHNAPPAAPAAAFDAAAKPRRSVFSCFRALRQPAEVRDRAHENSAAHRQQNNKVVMALGRTG